MVNFFQWFWDLLQYIGIAWNWLITPLASLENLIGISIAPIYLIGSAALTIGILRAIL